jgi:formylmethanofuran dehydrogenase subunit E
MNAKIASHIIKSYPQYLNKKEAEAVLHHNTIIELASRKDAAVHYKERKLYRDKGLLSKDLEVLTMLSQGFEYFQIQVARRILERHAESIAFTQCHTCGEVTSAMGLEVPCSECLSEGRTVSIDSRPRRYA